VPDDASSALFSWWSVARRERDRLPWRREHDPWKILVAEVMLAQTQVGRVAARYGAVIERVPTPAAAAALSVAEAVELWSGLGYYRRAIGLVAAGEEILRVHRGRVPDELADLLALPGVGPYIARAVLAFAYHRPVGVVDTNTRRVLVRAWRAAPGGTALVQRLADTLVPAERAREWNLALMDLGALVCTSRAPACSACPLGRAGTCRWRAAGGTDPAQATTPRSAPFVGSVRQVRGSLLAAAMRGPLDIRVLGGQLGVDDSRLRSALEGLMADGFLVEARPGAFVLPGGSTGRGERARQSRA